MATAKKKAAPVKGKWVPPWIKSAKDKEAGKTPTKGKSSVKAKTKK